MSRAFILQGLQARTLSELHGLRGTLYRERALTPQHSPEARQTLVNLDAVTRIIRMRMAGPGPG